ncbi:MAG: S26 family signal peptidase [Planctomycetota bacterium]|nr:S26 family signal peptidase [Planctomycetota bacterium]
MDEHLCRHAAIRAWSRIGSGNDSRLGWTMTDAKTRERETGARIVDDDARMAGLCADLLREGTPVRLRLGGGSMRPFLRHGDCCTIVPAKGLALSKGAIVAYNGPHGHLIVHRVVLASTRHSRPGYYVKGDMVLWREWVERGRILGKVVAIERGGRTMRLDGRGSRFFANVVATLSPLLSCAGGLVLGLARSLGR